MSLYGWFRFLVLVSSADRFRTYIVVYGSYLISALYCMPLHSSKLQVLLDFSPGFAVLCSILKNFIGSEINVIMTLSGSTRRLRHQRRRHVNKRRGRKDN
uniref:Uncharacterized protein n=1 Tax=Kalanchoe fedtschenkoi TaxID=63787 RepID=A0A7N0ZZ46_KALFE